MPCWGFNCFGSLMLVVELKGGGIYAIFVNAIVCAVIHHVIPFFLLNLTKPFGTTRFIIK